MGNKTALAMLITATLSSMAIGSETAAGSKPGTSSTEAKKPAPAKWPEYKGKSFKVSYPPSFKGKPLEAKTAKASDAATFTSADGAMAFYIFSPQWGGTPPDIALDAATEVETARNTGPGKSSGVNGTFTWHTITAKDKSYTRTYQSFQGKDEPIHWVIGMKFTSEAALKQYKAEYARFKASLEQYAD